MDARQVEVFGRDLKLIGTAIVDLSYGGQIGHKWGGRFVEASFELATVVAEPVYLKFDNGELLDVLVDRSPDSGDDWYGFTGLGDESPAP